MKLQSVNDSIFKIAGISYTKGDYVPVWKNLNYTNNIVDDDKAVPTVNIINKNTNLGIFNDYVSFTRFVDSAGTPYTDAETFALALATTISGNATSVGPTGPTGPQGPAGPAGLTWKGAWVSGTSYLVNDAVGYSGASYFCIANTSGTTTPNLATTDWALLASQGAVGPAGATGATGATGPQGPTGPAGPGSVGSSGYTTATISFPYVVLPHTVNFVINNADSILRRVTLNVNRPIGTRISVTNAGLYNFAVTGAVFGGQIYYNGINGSVLTEVVIAPNQEYVFTNVDGMGTWLSEFVEPKQTFKTYRASMQETSGGPVLVTEFENTLGGAVTLVNDFSGFKLTSSGLFTNLKTFVPAVTYQGNGQVYSLFPTIMSPSEILYVSKRANDDSNGTAFSSALIHLEVLVYN